MGPHCYLQLFGNQQRSLPDMIKEKNVVSCELELTAGMPESLWHDYLPGLMYCGMTFGPE